MSRRILIVLGHPDDNPGRLCRALAAAYAEGARAAGHHVQIIDIVTLDFPILRAFRVGGRRQRPQAQEMDRRHACARKTSRLKGPNLVKDTNYAAVLIPGAASMKRRDIRQSRPPAYG
jgi:hypothetical protein